jgi:hypothetical protein
MNFTRKAIMTAPLLMLLLFVIAASAAELDHAKPMTSPDPSVTVRGEDGKSEAFDEVALAKLPQREVRAEAHGQSVTCDGPALSDVVAQAGAPQGEALRGKELSLYVKVSARDNYHVVYSLAEIDPAMRAEVPIVATRCDGAKLDDKLGPFRIINPGEKRPARWVRQVNSIEVLRTP